MKTCLTPECGNITEGSTDFCASCNSRHRKVSKARAKAALDREAKFSKPVAPRQKVNKVSKKRKVLNAEYSILREQFLIDHPNCELKLQGCTGKSTQVHHTASGWNKSTNLNNVKTWRASCDHCNQFLHDKISAQEARELGLKV